MNSERKTQAAADDSGPSRIPGGVEWRRGDLVVSTDPQRLDVQSVASFLAGSYWATGIGEDVVRRSIDHSIAFGLYDGDRQVGFARAVTDRATFAWIGDVYVVEEYRGRGLALWLMRCVLAHPDLQGLRRWLLATRDAHGLYEKLGFGPIGAPDRFMELAPKRREPRPAEARPSTG